MHSAISLEYIQDKFTNEEEANMFLSKVRFGDNPSCTSCKSYSVKELKYNGKITIYKCSECKTKFHAKTNNVINKTRIQTHKLLQVIYLFSTGASVAEIVEKTLVSKLQIKTLSSHMFLGKLKKPGLTLSTEVSLTRYLQKIMGVKQGTHIQYELDLSIKKSHSKKVSIVSPVEEYIPKVKKERVSIISKIRNLVYPRASHIPKAITMEDATLTIEGSSPENDLVFTPEAIKNLKKVNHPHRKHSVFGQDSRLR